MRLKPAVLGIFAVSGLTWALSAAPLKEATVPVNAKWVLHLDMDAFRKTAIGSHIVDEVFENTFQKYIQGSQREGSIRFNTSLTNIQSITAYGATFGKDGEGALLLKTTANVKQDMEALVGVTAMDDKEDNEVTQVSDSPYLLYTDAKQDLFIAPDVDGTVILAKSQDQVNLARAALLGESKGISGEKLFAKYPKAGKSFFFLGMAEGFGQGDPVPPQAQVLREAEGGRLIIGEEEEDLLLNLVLRGKTAEATTRIQQVLQGIVALLSLSQDNPELTRLASSTKISSEGQNITVNLKVPVSTVMEKFQFHSSYSAGDESDPNGEVSVGLTIKSKDEPDSGDDSNEP